MNQQLRGLTPQESILPLYIGCEWERCNRCLVEVHILENAPALVVMGVWFLMMGTGYVTFANQSACHLN